MLPLTPLLDSRLRQSLRRWWMRQAIWAGVWGWLMAASVAGAQLLGLRLDWIEPVPIWLPALLGATGMLLGLVWSARRAPTLQQLAQQADRVFGLEEQLSTAREFSSDAMVGTHVEQVRRLQQQKAATEVGQLDPRRLVPLVWPDHGRWALLLSLVAAGLYFWPGLEQGAVSRTTQPVSPAAEALVQQLDDLEQTVRQDAERRNDPVLQATAQTLRRLQQDVRENRLSPQQLDQEVEVVMQRVQQNYGVASKALPTSAPSDSSGKPASTASSSSETPVPAESAAEETPAPGQQASPQPAQAQQKVEETINRLQQQAANQKPGTSEAAGKTPPPPKAQSSCGNNCQQEQPTDQYSAGAKQEAERRAMEAARRPPGGDPGGYGNEAGQGSPSQTAAGGKNLPPRESITTVKVSARPANTGSRIKISAPPSSADSEVRVRSDVGRVSFVRQTEEAMPLQPVEPRNRTVVARYFAPSEENP